jgi:hypothetical protein
MGYAIMTYLKKCTGLLRKYSWVSPILTWITIALIAVVIYISPARANVSDELRDACFRGEEIVQLLHSARENNVTPEYVFSWLVNRGYDPVTIQNFVIMVYYQHPDKDLGWLTSDFLKWCLSQKERESF